jgi:hypothetical protein
VDWQAAETGLRGWVLEMSGIDPSLVAWDREPWGYRVYPQVDLRLGDHRGRDGITPEIVYPPPDVNGWVKPSVVGQRLVTWSITVTTRDQHADTKAYVVLDQLAMLMQLPYSQDLFAELGLALIGSDQAIVSLYPPSEHRDLSQASLRTDFGYVLCVTAPAGTLPDSATTIIEHAEVGGVVVNITEPIIVPPEMMSPLPPPPPSP